MNTIQQLLLEFCQLNELPELNFEENERCQSSQDKLNCKQAGMDMFIAKPFKLPAIEEAITKPPFR